MAVVLTEGGLMSVGPKGLIPSVLRKRGIRPSFRKPSRGGSRNGTQVYETPEGETVKVTDYRILANGTVQVNGVNYRGNTFISSLGKTANELQREAFRSAREQGITKKGTYNIDYSLVDYSGTGRSQRPFGYGDKDFVGPPTRGEQSEAFIKKIEDIKRQGSQGLLLKNILTPEQIDRLQNIRLGNIDVTPTKQRDIKVIQGNIKQTQQEIIRLLNKGNLTFNERKNLEVLINRRDMQIRSLKKEIQTGELSRAGKRGRIETLQGKLMTKESRGKSTALEQAGLFTIGFAIGLRNNALGLANAPQAVNNLLRNPKNILQLPNAIMQSGAEIGYLLRTSPSTALGLIGAEVVTLKVTSGAIRITGRVSKQALSKVGTKLKFTRYANPLKFKPGKSPSIRIPTVEGAKLAKAKKIAKQLKREIREFNFAKQELGKDIDKGIKQASRTLRQRFEKQAGRKLSFDEALDFDKYAQERIRKSLIKNNGDLIELRMVSKTIRKKSFVKELTNKFRRFKKVKARPLKIRKGRIKLRYVKPRPKPKIKISRKISQRLKNIERRKKQRALRERQETAETLKEGSRLRMKKIDSLARKFLDSAQRKAGRRLEFFEYERLKRSLVRGLNDALKKGKFRKINLNKINIPERPFLEIIKSPREIRTKLIDKIVKLKEIPKSVKSSRQLSQEVSTGRNILIKRSQPVQRTVKKIKFLTQKVQKNKIDLAKRIKELRARQLKVQKLQSELARARRLGRKTSLLNKSLSVAIRGLSIYRNDTIKMVKNLNLNQNALRSTNSTLLKQTSDTVKVNLPVIRTILRQDSKLSSINKTLKKSVKILEEKKKLIRLPVIPEIRKRKIVNSSQAYNVYSKPVKGKRLVKVNKVPLTKTRAEDLRNYIADTSLSRTATIKPTSGKPRQPRLKVPSGYASKTQRKFRTYRIRKGRKVRRSEERVIERTRNIVDTRGEKRGISLRQRIAQLSRKRRSVKKVRRKRR